MLGYCFRHIKHLRCHFSEDLLSLRWGGISTAIMEGSIVVFLCPRSFEGISFVGQWLVNQLIKDMDRSRKVAVFCFILEPQSEQ